MKKSFFKDNKLIIDTLYYYVGKIIPGLVGFFSVPIFIRLFGTTIYGEYSILISTILLLSTFLSGWIGQTFMRFYTKKENKPEYIELWKTLDPDPTVEEVIRNFPFRQPVLWVD